MLTENAFKVKHIVRCAVILEPYNGVYKAIKKAGLVYQQLGYDINILSEGQVEAERYLANREQYLK